jgi:hypothetical protein
MPAIRAAPGFVTVYRSRFSRTNRYAAIEGIIQFVSTLSVFPGPVNYSIVDIKIYLKRISTRQRRRIKYTGNTEKGYGHEL